MPVSATKVRLDASLDQRLRRLAEVKSLPTEQLIGQAIAAFADREEAREDLDRATVEAWEHYAATGLHLTHEEVEAWFDKILAGQDVDLPECHS